MPVLIRNPAHDPAGGGFSSQMRGFWNLADLDARENAIRAEEQRMLALKKEIMEKIDSLKALETQLTEKLDAENTEDRKRLKDLAKVYEATPPQKAAAMLEKLETKTAAGITISMKRDKAGLIWGYLNPQKAVEITREITRQQAYQPAHP